MKESRRFGVALALLLAASLALRLTDVGFGLPAAYHPDEVNAVFEVQRLLGGDLELRRYAHPPLQRTLAFLGLEAWRRVLGRPGVPEAPEVTLALRLVSVLSGTAAVLAVALLAGRFVGPGLALLAAALYAVLPLAVASARYGLPDTLLSALYWLGSWQAVRLAERPETRAYASLGLLVALSIAAKYDGVLLLPAALLAHLLARRSGASPVPTARACLAAGVGLLAGLLAGFPFLLSEWRDIVSGVRGEADHLFGAGHRGFAVTVWAAGHGLYHLRHSILPATGPVLLGAALLGLVLLGRARGGSIVLAAVVPHAIAAEAVYLVFPSAERYALPVLGPLMLGAVLAQARLLGALPSRYRTAACGALAVVLAAHPAARTASLLRTLTPDTRDAMGAFLAASLPQGARIWVEPLPAYSPRLDPERFHVLLLRPSAPRGLADGDYVLASSLAYDRYFAYPSRRPEATAFYRSLFASGPPIEERRHPEGPYLFQNPTLRLYRWRGR